MLFNKLKFNKSDFQDYSKVIETEKKKNRNLKPRAEDETGVWVAEHPVTFSHDNDDVSTRIKNYHHNRTSAPSKGLYFKRMQCLQGG